jgi:serine phosphatase RsbU (regulator of sigma subunit)
VLGLLGGDVRFEMYLRSGGDLVPVLGHGVERPGRLLESLRRAAGATGRLGTSLACAPRCGASLLSAQLFDQREKPTGVVVVEHPAQRPDFTRREQVALESVAALLSLAIQRLSAARTDPDRGRIQLDRGAAARRVQQKLVAGGLPPDVGLTAHVAYVPSFEVGGDFFKLKALGDRLVGATIGDVSGNGVSAALVMARLSADVERTLDAATSPAATLGALNDRLSELDADQFVTASCVRLDTRTRRLTIANAGHLPLVIRRRDGTAFACGGASGMPLGTLPCAYDDEEIPLRASDIVLLMTDGLLEALDYPSGREGLSLLVQLVEGAPHDARAVSAQIRKIVDEARRAGPLDDATWVALQLAA